MGAKIAAKPPILVSKMKGQSGERYMCLPFLDLGVRKLCVGLEIVQNLRLQLAVLFTHFSSFCGGGGC